MLATNPDVRTRIQKNLANVRRKIEAACVRAGRRPSDVTLVAVTKSVGIEECRILLDLGVEHLGENRIESAEPKIATLGTRARWHMIGTVQRRKVPRVVVAFDRVDSVDRTELAEALDARAAETGKSLPILLQVNVSRESSKHGFEAEDLPDALTAIGELSHLSIEGLMTMAPLGAEPGDTRAAFRELAELSREHALPVLSMGMTNDFEIAIEEGATEVRIGTALYQ